MLVPFIEPAYFELLPNDPPLIKSASTKENNANAITTIRKNERCLIFDKIAIL